MVVSRTLAFWLCFASAAISADLPVMHIRNFDRVNDHIYRSGEPSVVGLQELGALGVKRVIDLREKGEATAFEKETLEKLGIKYTNIPFAALSAPSDGQIQSVLKLLTDNDSSPVLLHCRRGKDRTGTVIACYRIQHDGWDNRRALAEAKEHGMSRLERSMQAYILHFTPTSLSALGSPVH
ncbi:MAG: tyrosine-protein phosphatase [Acidobacteriaceae bacterium]|nr:tyrosine-protein phosphatase [Acidobacteriaceae bacterium]